MKKLTGDFKSHIAVFWLLKLHHAPLSFKLTHGIIINLSFDFLEGIDELDESVLTPETPESYF